MNHQVRGLVAVLAPGLLNQVKDASDHQSVQILVGFVASRAEHLQLAEAIRASSGVAIPTRWVALGAGGGRLFGS
ncbi:MAG: hypothetical protein ABJL35_00050 [Parasphingorhabdus sp.]|uniref:hypothetical protein n=1 Tax=Parasphingorhabdus sp. TaxID=2709688 RepID=UPI003296FCB0